LIGAPIGSGDVLAATLMSHAPPAGFKPSLGRERR
jgi:hypothetical protein